MQPFLYILISFYSYLSICLYIYKHIYIYIHTCRLNIFLVLPFFGIGMKRNPFKSWCPVFFFYKESWALKNWCFWTVALEKTLESPLDCKKIQPVHPKGDQSWVFIGRTEAETEAPILWPPDAKNLLTGKDPDAGERLKAGGEEDDRGWDGWMASPTWWTGVWVSSRSWWWTGESGKAAVRGVVKSWTQLSSWTELFFGPISVILWALSYFLAQYDI